MEETLEAFVAMFGNFGYIPCAGEENEVGFERVAIFEKSGIPTHAARQFPSGHWTSKLGVREDIEHDLRAEEGDAYGTVAFILKRPLLALSA